MRPVAAFALALLVMGLAACKEDIVLAEKPEPIALTEEAAGHYCQMVILEHEGPKAQIHIQGYPAPLWFSQVRDGLAFLKSPEKIAQITAIYVNDMGAAASWAAPGENNWIEAANAFFVVGSNAKGGMGAPEIVPFANEDAAKSFIAERGGEIMLLDDIPAETVLAPIELSHVSGH